MSKTTGNLFIDHLKTKKYQYAEAVSLNHYWNIEIMKNFKIAAVHRNIHRRENIFYKTKYLYNSHPNNSTVYNVPAIICELSTCAEAFHTETLRLRAL